jgi:hypothetical protein
LLSVSEHLAHRLSLCEHAVDELGPYATADPQMLSACSEQTTAVLDGDPAPVALRVDHGDAGRADGDVVDDAAACRHAPIVQEGHARSPQPRRVRATRREPAHR